MWSTIASFVLKAIDTTYFKIAWVVSLCFVVGSLTYSYQAHKYDAQIAQIQSSLAEATAKQEKEYASKLSKATSDLVLANRRADDARSERDDLLKRMRTADARETERTAASPDRSYRTEYAQCRKFLSEGADLLGEGDDLARRLASERDALAELVK